MSMLKPLCSSKLPAKPCFGGSLPGWSILLLSILLLPACGTVHKTRVLGQNDDYLVLQAGSNATPSSLAAAYLGDPKLDWRIEDANQGAAIKAGQYLVIPLKPSNPTGVFSDGFQTVPILSYHRFGAGNGKLTVAKRQFEEQMRYLKTNGYRVIPLQQVFAFLRGEAEIPRRSVVLTIDDGYRSVYHIAFPILKKYEFPATIFIYTDYIGNGGLNWRQMSEMEASGLITFQGHSKTDDNRTVRLGSESMEDYKKRLVDEVGVPTRLLGKRMQSPQLSFAYPFGAVNQPVVDELRRNGYQVGVTVDRGANPFFTYPYALRRTMIYEKDGMPEFKKALQVFHTRNLR